MEIQGSSIILIGSVLVRRLVGFILFVAGVSKLRAPSNRFLKAVIGYELADLKRQHLET